MIRDSSMIPLNYLATRTEPAVVFVTSMWELVLGNKLGFEATRNMGDRDTDTSSKVLRGDVSWTGFPSLILVIFLRRN